MLSTQVSPGAEILASAEANDPALAEWVESNGSPEYVLPTSSRSLMLFDLDRDVAATASWSLFGAGEPIVESKIRATHSLEFSNRDRQRLGDLRRAKALEAERARRRRAREAAREAYFRENPTPETGGGVLRGRRAVEDEPQNANSAPENDGDDR